MMLNGELLCCISTDFSVYFSFISGSIFMINWISILFMLRLDISLIFCIEMLDLLFVFILIIYLQLNLFSVLKLSFLSGENALCFSVKIYVFISFIPCNMNLIVTSNRWFLSNFIFTYILVYCWIRYPLLHGECRIWFFLTPSRSVLILTSHIDII